MRKRSAPETFGEWLKLRRKRLDLTQTELGTLAGCSGAAIRKFEADERKPSRNLAELLANALQIPITEREEFIRLARGALPAYLPAGIAIEPTRQTTLHSFENLPAPLTSLVDRVQAVADLTTMLRDPAIRWVSLIGPPGIGKTRLSIQTGRQMLDQFADGVWFVDLAPLEQAALVLPALSRAMTPLDLPQAPTLDQCANSLKKRSILLVLDNFEHVTGAAVEVAELLKRCAGLKVLATSRIPLHIYGEHEYRVPPLSIPPAKSAKKPGTLLSYESVQLLLARIRQHQPAFVINLENAPLIVDICATLEGMPLGLELAAASLQRMTMVQMNAILHHLDGGNWIKSFRAPAVDLPARQHTLENMVAWSYSLLSEVQGELFCRLGIFSNCFDLDAVVDICFDEPRPLRSDVRSLLDALSDHSLLVRETLGDIPCWRMQEIIHAFAALKLDSGTRVDLEQRFSHYFLDRLHSSKEDNGSQKQDVFFKIHVGNLHSALKWFISTRKPELGFQMAESLDDLWLNQGFYKEGLELTKQLFALPDESAPDIRANHFQQASDLAWQVHDFETAIAFAQQAAELGRIFNLRGQYPWYLNRLGRIYIEQGRYGEARQVLTECLTQAQNASSDLNIGCPLAQLGEVALFENRMTEAKSNLEEALNYLGASDSIFLAIATVDMAEIALAEGEYDLAHEWLKRAYEYSGLLMRRTLVFLSAVAGYLALSPASRQGEWLLAARLFGAIENLAEYSGIVLGSFYHQLKEQRTEMILHSLSRDAWQQELEIGRQWSKETAINAVMGVIFGG